MPSVKAPQAEARMPTSLDEASRPLLVSEDSRDAPTIRSQSDHGRGRIRRILESPNKHYAILGLIGLDVAALLANIFIELIACDMGEEDEPWVVHMNKALTLTGLVFSSLFLAELLLCVYAFGFKYNPPAPPGRRVVD